MIEEGLLFVYQARYSGRFGNVAQQFVDLGGSVVKQSLCLAGSDLRQSFDLFVW